MLLQILVRAGPLKQLSFIYIYIYIYPVQSHSSVVAVMSIRSTFRGSDHIRTQEIENHYFTFS